MLDFKRYRKYESLILRCFLGLTLFFWGYEKLTVPKLASSYLKDYEFFMFIDVKLFLVIAGIVQILLGIALILGIYTRLISALLALMAIVTIIIPGMIILRDVPHFAYAFATAGGAIVLTIEGSGLYSWDSRFHKKLKT